MLVDDLTASMLTPKQAFGGSKRPAANCKISQGSPTLCLANDENDAMTRR